MVDLLREIEGEVALAQDVSGFRSLAINNFASGKYTAKRGQGDDTAVLSTSSLQLCFELRSYQSQCHGAEQRFDCAVEGRRECRRQQCAE